MHSCHSSVNSVTGITPSVNTVSPRKSAVSICLNGLFGDGYGIDDGITTSLCAQSPAGRSTSTNKIDSISPSKSLSMELNYSQQPVLLSDLADGAPYSYGTSGSLVRGSTTLCSFVSPYDNSRCTNLASVASQSTKSFCHRHVEAAASSVQLSGIISKPDQIHLTSAAASTSFDSINTGMTTIQQTATSTSPDSRGLGQSHRSSATKKLGQGCATGSSMANGISFGEGRTTSLNSHQPPNPNIMFPVAYVNPRDQVGSPKTKKMNATSNVTSSTTRAVPIVAATVVNPSRKAKSIQIKPGNIQGGMNATGSAVPMDRGMLQAFVDFLNQNHDRLTPKQQLSLLNSVGVTVATVKNLDHVASIKQQSLSGKLLQTASLPSSVPPLQAAFNHNVNFVSKSNKIVSESAVAANSLKRKQLSVGQEDSKKLKKDTVGSLQHLTTKELDEKVQQTIASLELTGKGEDKPTPVKSKVKVSTSQTGSWKTDHRLVIPPPTVTINMNQLKHQELYRKNTLNKPLKQYLSLERHKQTMHSNLFSLGPFCDEEDCPLLCKCPPKAHVVSVPPKTKSKMLKHNQEKTKRCSRCTGFETTDPSLNFYDTLLHSLSCNDQLGSEPSEDTLHRDTVEDDVAQSSNSSSSASSLPAPDHPATARSYCRYLSKGTKLWKKLRKRENESIRWLTAAAESNLAETSSLLKAMGQRTSIGLKKRSRCGSMSDRCSLVDRVGNRCTSGALPLSNYCRDHIMHCNQQQLYKLDADMNVTADVYPDPPVVRQRKKTKLPPLSKRKKRRTRKRNKASIGNSAAVPATEKSDESAVQRRPAFHISHPAISDYVADTSDEILTDPNLAKMPSVMNDPSLSLKTNLLTENLPSGMDEESNSGMFEAFSFDGEELLPDVITPDMFSEFDLDNAFLLTGDTDTIDKLSLDELNDDESLYPAATSSQETSQTTSVPQLASAGSETCDSGQPAANTVPSSSVEPSFSASDVEQFKWLPAVDVSNVSPVKSSYGFADVSSLDSSFTEDLNELEGVIQSLHNDSLNQEPPLTPATPQSVWNALDNSNAPVTTVSSRAEENLKSLKEVQFPKSVETSCDLISMSNASTLSCSLPQLLPAHYSAFSQPSVGLTNFNQTLLTEEKEVSSASSNRSQNVSASANGTGAQATVKPVKRPKSKTSPRKRTNAGVQSHAPTLPNGFQLIVGSSVPEPGENVHSQPNPGLNPLLTVANGIGVTDRTKQGKKNNFTSSGLTCASTVVNPTVRVQPRLVSAGAAGKTNTNQNMILIPVNAVMRTNNNQLNAPATNQNLGIAFAIPAQNLASNISTMLPFKGSTLVAGAAGNQQVLILGGNPSNNVVFQPNVNFNQTLYHNSNSTSRPSQAGVNKSNLVFHLQTTTAQSPSNATQCPPTPKDVSTPVSSSAKSVKRQHHPHSIVIPPSLPITNHIVTSMTSNAATVSPNPTQSTSNASSCTVHWNQSMGAAPVPQRRPSEGVGGQTSNMLCCRRLNPSLNNNNKHVIVGRLGSLGQVGMSRVTVKDQSGKSVQSRDDAKSSSSHSKSMGQTNAGPVTSLFGTDFIPLSPNAMKSPVSRRSNPNDCATQAPGSSISSKHTLTNGIGAVDESLQLRDLSNQLRVTKSETTGVESVGTQFSVANPSRHGSRKSDHSLMLNDPDFCESPTKVLSNGRDHSKASVVSHLSAQGNCVDEQSVASSNTNIAFDSTSKSLLTSGKLSRRATILRKR